jgi:hypothetical protein
VCCCWLARAALGHRDTTEKCARFVRTMRIPGQQLDEFRGKIIRIQIIRSRIVWRLCTSHLDLLVKFAECEHFVSLRHPEHIGAPDLRLPFGAAQVPRVHLKSCQRAGRCRFVNVVDTERAALQPNRNSVSRLFLQLEAHQHRGPLPMQAVWVRYDEIKRCNLR